MAKVGNVGPLRPVWPQKPQDKFDPRKEDASRRKSPPSPEEDPNHKTPNGDDQHIDDYA